MGSTYYLHHNRSCAVSNHGRGQSIGSGKSNFGSFFSVDNVTLDCWMPLAYFSGLLVSFCFLVILDYIVSSNTKIIRNQMKLFLSALHGMSAFCGMGISLILISFCLINWFLNLIERHIKSEFPSICRQSTPGDFNDSVQIFIKNVDGSTFLVRNRA